MTVYQLTQSYPEIIDIMASLGFTEIRRKAMRHSVGKIVTLAKGAAMRGIDVGEIVEALQHHGFAVDGYEHNVTGDSAEESTSSHNTNVTPPDTTSIQIKSYLKRLNNGEPMNSVRADFVQQFKDVDAMDIMKAEQELIEEGQPIKEVKELCDVHSALFHNTSQQDDKRLKKNIQDQEQLMNPANDNIKVANDLKDVPGHPLQTLYKENEVIANILKEVEATLKTGEDVASSLKKGRVLAVHYAKKGDLIYPLLNVGHNISGPSQVMWTIDDEIRSEISKLLKQSNCQSTDTQWGKRVGIVVQRAQEMIFKENNILFPVIAANFTDKEWKQIYVDSKGYGNVLGVNSETWEDGEKYLKALQTNNNKTKATDSTDINMPGGSLTPEQLTALLDTLPMEITFIDANNINRYFNQPFTEKIFKRPLSALGREVFTCHPPKIEPMVRGIIQDFRDGKRDSLPIWMQKNGRPTLVTYMAVRDISGHYIGTVEIVQDMEAAREHFKESK